MSGGTDYAGRLAEFLRMLGPLGEGTAWRSEFLFETLRDEALLGTLDDVVRWYEDCRANTVMRTQPIPLLECREWTIEPASGALVHSSGEFFRVEGLRTLASPTREVDSGWDQPILTQVGYDGGILGLLRKRFDGVPHYLVEAKAEPGNYRTVQITTTIQATFSNLKRAHGGKGTPYAEYFTAPADNAATVVAEQWMSEDGGRLNHKRNRTMLVEVPEDHPVAATASRYRWVGLYQIKELLRREDAIVAPHLRGVLALV